MSSNTESDTESEYEDNSDEEEVTQTDNHNIECIRETEQETIIETIIKKESRKTSDEISVPEFTALIGRRAQLLLNGEPPYIPTTELQTPDKIACRELVAGRFMLLLVRKIGNGFVEIWDPNEMKLDKCPIANILNN